MYMRDFSKIKRVIVKVGSSSLVKDDLSINEQTIDFIMHSFFQLKKEGIDPTLVTSGAVAIGIHELGLTSRPKEMSLKQACASVGQAKLMEAYNQAASKYDLKTGQILLNHDDFQYRDRMLHLSSTLDAMFKNNIVPIINENDALAVEEIKVGDNDTLASLICPMIECDLLILFSDIDGLFDKNPKENKDAKMIPLVTHIDESIISSASKGISSVGTGGMKTKIKAALISTSSSSHMIICNANKIPDLVSICKGEEIGTLFLSQAKTISSRENWMIFKAKSKGKIIVDNGCIEALKRKKVSILPKGIIEVKNDFLKGEVIEVVDKNERIFAKGICKFSSNEIDRIKGKDSLFLPGILGYKCKDEVIHATDLVLLFDFDLKMFDM